MGVTSQKTAEDSCIESRRQQSMKMFLSKAFGPLSRTNPISDFE